MSEKRCERCGEVGYDRRTLWMACLYDMQELNIPLKEVGFFGALGQDDGIENSVRFPGLTIRKFLPPPDDVKPRCHTFFTMLVCKECRASWMEAIKRWHESKRENIFSGDVPVRMLGGTEYVSEEEWQQRQEGSDSD